MKKYLVLDSETGESMPLNELLSRLAQGITEEIAERIRPREEQILTPNFFKRIMVKGIPGKGNKEWN